MLERKPDEKEMTALIGQSLYEVWSTLCAKIEERYDTERLLSNGGKAWTYEYKYRKGGKTLCALYARENCIGFMVILGKEEREKFEASRNDYTQAVRKVYDEATTYHDGKWIMFQPVDTVLFDDFMRLLNVKRKPNKK